MRITLLLCTLALLGLFVTSAMAESPVDGKWIAQVPGRDGQTRETTFTFKADGAKLTGTVSGRQADRPISDGKIEGNNLSFNLVYSGGGGEMKFTYIGVLAGNEIKFKRTREGGDTAQEFTAKKQ
jgi:hypothetical protein